MTNLTIKATNAMTFLPHRTSKYAVFALVFGAVALIPVGASAAPSGTMGPKNPPAASVRAAPDAAFRLQGSLVKLATYRDRKRMIWEVATWCGSCKAGLKAFAHHQALIDKSDMKIIVLRDYKNGGYPGITIDKFAAKVAPSLLKDPHCVFGEATKAFGAAYNPRHFVDIYQLVDARNRIVLTSSAPSVTFGKIEHFIASGAK